VKELVDVETVRILTVLEANKDSGSICFTSPVIGSLTSIGFAAVPVAIGFNVR
jgi:hypothetical protein